MATVHTTIVNNWRGFVDYTTSISATHVSVTVTSFGMQACGYGFNINSGCKVSVWRSNQAEWAVSGGIKSAYNSWDWTGYWSGTSTVNYPRTTSAYNVGIGVSASNASGFMNGSAGSAGGDHLYVVPALDSYSIVFNANGGTGAPGAQIKWYGTNIALSATRPTRTNHIFLGWSTSATATTATYAAGATYTANSGVTLYAVWKLNYIKPTLTLTEAFRANSAGTKLDSGTYIRVTGSWKVDTTVTSTNKATNLKIEYKATDSATWISGYSANPNAASGNIAITVGGNTIALAKAYNVRVTISDAGGSDTATALVGQQFRTFDIANNGRSVAIGQAASDTETAFDVGIRTRFNGDQTHIKNLYRNGSIMADHVTVVGRVDTTSAHGNRFKWNYKKYSSGRVMAFGQSYGINPNLNQDYHGHRYAAELSATYPFSFSLDTLMTSVSLYNDTGNGLLSINQRTQSSTGCAFYIWENSPVVQAPWVEVLIVLEGVLL